jgi:hypothetical protein
MKVMKQDFVGSKGMSGEKMPKGVAKADTKSERHESMRGGVAMGMEDKVGKDKLFNTGRTEGVCYEHDRSSYR